MRDTGKLLSEGAVLHKSMPAWWHERQRAAWQRYEAAPTPTRQSEDWRFANIAALQFEPYHADVAIESPQSVIEISSPGFETESRAVFANDNLLDFQEISSELSSRGVIWEPLHTAAAKHEALLKKYFMARPIELGSQKFAALHEAFCRGGMLLYVPKNVEVKLPLTSFYWLCGEVAFCMPHTLIIAEANSKVTIVDFFRSYANAPGLACNVNDLYVGQGAQVTYVAVQNWSEKVHSFQLNATRVEKDASAKSLFVNLGGLFARLESKSELVGTGARSEMLGLSVGDDRQEFDQRTLQQHVAPNTWSDLLYKNALNFHSKSIFKGLIRVEPGAARTDAYQTNRNLLLSQNAEANSMPGLEILNDDVKCSHGATVGQIDAIQLFYMKQRGIPEKVAKKLLAFGFFEEVFERLGNSEIAVELERQVEVKFLNSKGQETEILKPEAELQQV